MYLAAGTIIDQRYEIISRLGVGGFGAVYSAKQINLDRMVALKIIHEHQGFSDDARARFEREAQTLAKLKHKNLALFYGFGIWDDSPYMVLELVRGRSLHSVIQEEGRIKESRTINIIKNMCDALSCIHSNGIVHRDLKPANIMLVEAPDGTEVAKLIDFGLAKVDPGIGEHVQRLTEAGSTVGSAEYMSPEQCLGKPLDGRSDIYALGCTMQACLIGRAPFMGEHSVVVMQQHIYDPPPPLSDSLEAGTYTEALQLILNQALAKEKEERYETADEFRADLSKASGHDTTKLKAASAARPVGLRVKFGRKKKLNIAVVAIAAGCISGFFFWNWQTQGKHIEPHSGELSQESSLYLYKQGLHEGEIAQGGDRLIDMFTRAIAANEKDHMLDLRLSARAKRRLCWALSHRRRFAESLPYLISGLDDEMKAGETDAAFSELVTELGMVCRHLHERALAIEKIKVADEYYRKRIGKRNPVVCIALSEAYRLNNQPDVALKLCQELESIMSDEDKHYSQLRQEMESARAQMQSHI